MIVRKGSVVSEDWLSLWMGLSVFLLSLGLFVGFDFLAWGIKTSVCNAISGAVSNLFSNVSGLPVILSLVITCLFIIIIASVVFPRTLVKISSTFF